MQQDVISLVDDDNDDDDNDNDDDCDNTETRISKAGSPYDP